MMEKINLVELLKDCPKGMELDCINYDGVVTFEGIINRDCYPIKISIKYGNESFIHTLTKYGQTCESPYCKCVIFPKGKTTWKGFQRPFKDGDILTTKLGSIFIYHYSKLEEMSNKSICCAHIVINPTDKTILNNDEFSTYTSMCSFATEEEKQKLFQAIKDNGYKWNTETKTLEKLITPKFKVGDHFIHPTDSELFAIIEIRGYGNYKIQELRGSSYVINKHNLHEYLKVSKWNPKWFKPFDKVLVRDSQYDYWSVALFSHIGNNEIYPYIASCTKFKYCIPYNVETKYLVGTTLEEPEFYKI